MDEGSEWMSTNLTADTTLEDESSTNNTGAYCVADVLKIELEENGHFEGQLVKNEGNTPRTAAEGVWKAEEIEIDMENIPKFEADNEALSLLKEDSAVITYSCGLCNYETVKESSLLCHMRSHSQKTACPICGFVAGSKSELARHLPSHAKEVPYTCEHCQHGFFRLSSLEKHDCRQRPKVCQHCGAAFKYKTKLVKHIRAEHRKADVAPVPKKRYCHLCEFSCWSGDNLNAHLRTHSGNKTLHCPHCTFEFTKLAALQKHMRIHKFEQSFSCPYCEAVFAKYGVVKIHMELHKDGHLLSCGECNYTTPSRINLKAHRSRVHNPNKHKCPNCDYETGAVYRFNVHLLSHDKASHQCHQCDYRTKYKWDLKRHAQTHDKTPTYRCPHCTYTCSSLDSLKHHATRHTLKLPVPDFIGTL